MWQEETLAKVSRKLDIIDENDEQKVGQAEQLCYQTGGLCTRQEDAARRDRRQAVSGPNTWAWTAAWSCKLFPRNSHSCDCFAWSVLLFCVFGWGIQGTGNQQSLLFMWNDHCKLMHISYRFLGQIYLRKALLFTSNCIPSENTWLRRHVSQVHFLS